jgi:3-keto-disaccharide hydrolase
MLLHRLTVVVVVAVVCAALLPAEDPKPDTKEGFKPLFNGKDLAGWVNVNCHPDTFFVKGDEIITTGTPTGFLRTDRQYENFVLEMDWMHIEKTKTANSGLFVWGDPLPGVGTPYTRGIEVQVLINYPKVDWATNHGDIFSIHGAHCKPDRPHPKGYERCLPSEERVKGGGEWNHYKVTANDGAIKLEVNGKEVSGVSQCTPRKGYLALESEGAECHFKNLKIKELPSTNPKPEDVAKAWGGHVSVFNGIDLKGWTTGKDGWKAGGGVLRCASNADLVSEKKYGACELIFDWKVPAKAEKAECMVTVGGMAPLKISPGAGAKAGAWKRETLKTEPGVAPGSIVFHAGPGLEIMNVFVRELKEEKK